MKLRVARKIARKRRPVRSSTWFRAAMRLNSEWFLVLVAGWPVRDIEEKFIYSRAAKNETHQRIRTRR